MSCTEVIHACTKKQNTATSTAENICCARIEGLRTSTAGRPLPISRQVRCWYLELMDINGDLMMTKASIVKYDDQPVLYFIYHSRYFESKSNANAFELNANPSEMQSFL